MSDVALVAVFPALNAVDVAPDTDLAFTLYAPSGLLFETLEVVVDGVDAYTAGAFVRPAFAGVATSAAADYVAVRLVPRRSFLYNVKPVVSVAIGSTGFPTPVSFALDFVTRPPAGTLLDPALKQTAVDRGDDTYPALEAFRRAMLAAISGSTQASSLVVLYYRVTGSSLRSLVYLAPFAAVAARETPRLRGQDLGSTDAASLAFVRLLPLWEIALRELGVLGVASQDVDLLRQAGASPNPPEQVAAACALILVATQKLLDSGAIVA